MRPPLLTALLFTLATAVSAVCVDRPSRAIEIELSGCRPAAIALEEQVAGSPVWWLRPYVLSIVGANPGVLLRGRVRRERAWEPPESFGPWRENGGEEELFYTSRDGQLCKAFGDVEQALFLAEPPCCDRIPPPNTACLLEVDEIRPVPEHLLELVYGEREEADSSPQRLP